MNILFISRWFPDPPDNGSKLRVNNLIYGLAKTHQVTLLSFIDPERLTSYSTRIHSLCDQVHVVPWKEYRSNSTKALIGFFSLTPRSIKDTFSSEMANTIQNITSESKYDLVIASQIDMAVYNHYWGDVPALFEEIELGLPDQRFNNAKSSWYQVRYGLTWQKHRQYLAKLLRKFKAFTVVSENEHTLVKENFPGIKSVVVIPNCVNTNDYQDLNSNPNPNMLIFTGSFRYEANYDAMLWFLEDIYPRIKTILPGVRLMITGDHANLPLPPCEDITLTGFVDDVRPLIKSAGVSLVPLRVGGGTRLKILEAMALGTPVVATTKGAEGLDVQDGVHLLIGDTPEAFANHVIYILNDHQIRQQLISNAHQLILEKYDVQVVIPNFLNLVEKVGKS